MSWFTTIRDTASSWVSAIASNVLGSINVGNWAEHTFPVVKKNPVVKIAVVGTALGASVLPTVVQAYSYTKMMAALRGAEPSCTCGAKSCCCKSTVSQIYTALIKTIHSGASLSLLLTSILGLPAGYALTALFSLMYVLAQYYVANVGTATDDEYQLPNESNEKLNAIKKILAAGGGVAGVAGPAAGIINLAQWIHATSLNAVVDHTTGEAQLADLVAAIGALVPGFLQSVAYYANAKQALSGHTHDVLDYREPGCRDQLVFHATIYSALFKSLGAATGPVKVANLLFDGVLGWGPWPSVAVGLIVGGLSSWQQYAYINRDNQDSPMLASGSSWLKPINANQPLLPTDNSPARGPAPR